GGRTMGSGPGRLVSRQLLRKGSRKAAVLPVPVWAWPMTSRPARASGIRAAWIGVGWKYEARSRAVRTGGESDKDWKPFAASESNAVVKQTSEKEWNRAIACHFVIISLP